MQGIFITGTDTGVGKTYTALCLIRTARVLGINITAMKPFETGCSVSGRRSIPTPTDATKLMKACGTDKLAMVNQYRFTAPAAPYTAAQIENKRISIDRVLSVYNTLSKQYDFVVVEGAGGLLVPITKNFSYADLAKELALPVLIVSANKLGVINHTLLTVDYIANHRLGLLGVVLNNMTRKNDIAKKTNPHALSGLLGRMFLGEITFNNFRKDVALYKKILRLTMF